MCSLGAFGQQPLGAGAGEVPIRLAHGPDLQWPGELGDVQRDKRWMLARASARDSKFWLSATPSPLLPISLGDTLSRQRRVSGM